MLGALSSLPLILVWLLAATSAMEGCATGDVAEQVNTAKKPLEGVALLTATIPQTSPETERVSLSLQLTNLGKELLRFNDRPMETFSVKVKKKDGALLPTTRYFKELIDELKRADRNVLIELASGKKARVTLSLERLFDLSLEVEYLIDVEARFTVKGAAGKIAIENLPFTIRSTPFVRREKLK